MRVILDFDRTLFDTAKMIAETDKLLKQYGITSDAWRSVWLGQYAGHKYFRSGLYNVWEHIRRYSRENKLDSRKFIADYYKWHEKIVYLFPETLEFLNEIKKIAKLFLVTYGHRRFQEMKIQHSKTAKYFHKIEIVSTLKVKKFGKIIDKRDINVFIDDNPAEIDEVAKAYPEVVTIHILRRGNNFREPSKFRDFEVKNLREAKLIIETLAKKFIYNENQAVKALKKGQAVVYPTDTAYGLGVDATNVRAVERLYKIKERNFQKPVHVIVSSLAMAKRYVKFNKVAEKLWKKFMPGPLTLVLEFRPLPQSLPRPGGGGKGGVEALKLLSGGTGTLGIRMPDNKVALKLVRKLGRPITTTSANPSAHKSGGYTPYSIADSLKQFRDKKYQPDLYLDAGTLPKRKTSTIVRVVGNKIKVLRKGPINPLLISPLIRGRKWGL